jgi:hypothetical protein
MLESTRAANHARTRSTCSARLAMMPWRHRPTVETRVRREIAARTNSIQVKSSQVKSSQVKLKSLVSGGSNRREGRKRDVLPMHTFGTIVLPASHPLSAFAFALKNIVSRDVANITPQRTTPHATPLRQWSPCGPNARLAHARRMAIMAMPPASRNMAQAIR